MEEYVFGLDIPVQDVLSVHVLHGLTDLPHDILHRLLIQTLALHLQGVVEVLSEAGLEEEVDIVLVDVVLVQLDDVRVVQK